MTAIIYSDRRTADHRLSQYFNSTRSQWIDIVKAAVAARARCTDDSPKSAPGHCEAERATGSGEARPLQAPPAEGGLDFKVRHYPEP